MSVCASSSCSAVLLLRPQLCNSMRGQRCNSPLHAHKHARPHPPECWCGRPAAWPTQSLPLRESVGWREEGLAAAAGPVAASPPRINSWPVRRCSTQSPGPGAHAAPLHLTHMRLRCCHGLGRAAPLHDSCIACAPADPAPTHPDPSPDPCLPAGLWEMGTPERRQWWAWACKPLETMPHFGQVCAAHCAVKRSLGLV